MIPAGYLYKVVAPCPDWIGTKAVTDICSLSCCISEAFIDYVSYWLHNGYWLFDSPAIMNRIAAQEGVELSKAALFYYEVYDEQFDERSGAWVKFSPERSFATAVELPQSKKCLGYDVVTFWAGAGPECSPLSCNSLAQDIAVNAHCLFTSFDQARKALDDGAFSNTEPGPMRIFAVYTVE